MKSLSKFIQDSYAAEPAATMGPTVYPDVATSAADMMSPNYKTGSGDVPGTMTNQTNSKGRFLTVQDLKRIAREYRRKHDKA